MDQITKRSTNGTRFSVNRIYQPARIERELLAQIFDLMERGGRKDFEPGGAAQEPVVIAARLRSSDQVATSIVGVNNPSRITELENPGASPRGDASQRPSAECVLMITKGE